MSELQHKLAHRRAGGGLEQPVARLKIVLDHGHHPGCNWIHQSLRGVLVREVARYGYDPFRWAHDEFTPRTPDVQKNDARARCRTCNARSKRLDDTDALDAGTGWQHRLTTEAAAHDVRAPGHGFHRLFLVFAVAPLAVIGVVMALLPSGAPLGFVAILGVLALIGILIRNSVILIVQIEQLKEEGRPVWDAVVEATEHRMRPIMLTAAAASLALIPIAREIFWGPMAYAMMGGIIVGTVLTLLFLPALYVAWFRIKEPEPATDNNHESQTAPKLRADLPADALSQSELEDA
jgi:hypothetical protein